jgi:preprotein translocase subunit YajC
MQAQSILIDLFILAVFAGGVYAFLILPRQREFRRRQKLVRELEVGAEVLTFGGLVGTIKHVDSDSGLVRVEVGEGVEVQLVASAITAEFDREAVAKDAQRAMN